MHILVIGAAGMIGRKLVAALIARGELSGRPVERLTLADIVAPEAPKFAGKVETVAADLSEQGVAAKLVAARPDLIFHLAAIVSGEAEADFEKGYRVNLDGTRTLFEAIRLEGLKQPYRAEGRLHLLHRRLWRAAARNHRRHLFPDAADQLRHAEGDRRTAAGRLFAARLLRRHRHPPADHLDPARQAQQGRVRLLLLDPARAADRQGGGAAGRAKASSTGSPARARRRSSCCTPPRSTPRRSAAAARSPCRAWPRPSARRSRRCAASPARRR